MRLQRYAGGSWGVDVGVEAGKIKDEQNAMVEGHLDSFAV